MATHKNISKVEAVARKIIPVVPSRDSQGEYFGYCDFFCHRGIVGSQKARECEERMCSYYQKYYLHK
jgi:hypothetical protein